jgi:hypothetical protein
LATIPWAVNMPRLIGSSCIAILATLIALSSWLVASAAETANRAQTKAAAPALGGACSLITKEEVAAALAVAVTGPKEKAMADAAGPGSSISTCEYSGSGLQSMTLNVTRLPPSSAPMYRAMCAKKAKDGLDGLGELACWYNDKHQELHAFKGTTFVSIELRRSGDTTEAIKGVMKKALERLR